MGVGEGIQFVYPKLWLVSAWGGVEGVCVWGDKELLSKFKPVYIPFNNPWLKPVYNINQSYKKTCIKSYSKQ